MQIQRLLQPFHAKKELWFFFILAFIGHYDAILFGPYAAVNFFDTIDNDFPHFINQGRLLLDHGLFGWYPNNPGGMPSFVGQHPPYALPSLIAAFVPLWLFSLLWGFFSMSMLGYGTYRLLHSFFEIRQKTALLMGTIAAFIPLNQNPQFVMTFFFPLFFIWTHELCSGHINLRGKITRVIGLIAITASSYPVLSLPHFPIFHFFLYLTFGLKREHPVRNVAAVFMAWTGFVLFFAPSLYSLFEYIPYAQRDYSFGTHDIGHLVVVYADQFVARFSDNIFFSLLLLGIPLIPKSRMLKKTLWFILIPQALGVFFGTDTKSLLAGTFLLKMDLFLSTTVLTVSAALFAAVTIDILREAPQKLNKYWVLICILILVFTGNEQSLLMHALVLGSSICAILLFRTDGYSLKRPLLVLTIFCGCLAGFAMQVKQVNMHTSEHILYGRGFDNHPNLSGIAEHSRTTPFRVASADIHQSIAQNYGLETIDQRGVLFNKHYKQYFKGVIAPQFVKEPQIEGWFDSLWRYLIFTPSKIHKVTPSVLFLDAEQRSADDWNIPLLLNMNVQYILSGRPIKGMEKYAELQFHDTGEGLPAFLKGTGINDRYQLPIYGYRLKNPFGLGRVASRAIVVTTKEEAMKVMAEMNADQLRKTIVIAKEDAPDIVPEDNSTTSDLQPASVSFYSPDKIVFSGTTSGPGYFVVANNFDPRWEATLNGKETKVFQANNAFQAIRIPSTGTFEAVFTFHSPIVWWLHGVTLIGMALFASIATMVPFSSAPQRPEEDTGYQDKPHRIRALAAGGIAATLWFIGYYFFVFLKGRNILTPMEYIMVIVPFLGLMMSLFAERFTRD